MASHAGYKSASDEKRAIANAQSTDTDEAAPPYEAAATTSPRDQPGPTQASPASSVPSLNSREGSPTISPREKATPVAYSDTNQPSASSSQQQPPLYQSSQISYPSPQSSGRHATTQRQPFSIAIPQLCTSKGAPFARLYSPALTTYELFEHDFIQFLDTLNATMQANPVLKGLDMTGSFLRKVPLPVIGILGSHMTNASKFGNAQLSKGGVEAYMATSNESLFIPRGLRVWLCTGKQLKAKLFGDADASLLAPLDPNAPPGRQLTVHQRRTVGLQGRVAETKETTLPVGNKGYGYKLTMDQWLSTAKHEDDRLMHKRSSLFKGLRSGKSRMDAEEEAVEEMLWVLVETIDA